ncbi:hypothetical protein ACFLYT_00555 [Nanoarchaeota archaeon]
MTYFISDDVRYIFFTSQSPHCSIENSHYCIAPSMITKKTEVSALHISSAGDRSRIWFYSYDRDDEDFVEVGETKHIDFNPQNPIEKKYPSLYGAILTDDLEIYNCMFGKAFKRHTLVTKIYLDRITKMRENASDEMKILGCPFLYPQPESSLTSLLSAVTDSSCSPIFNPGCNPPDFYLLEQQNTDLLVNSCPLVY